MNKILGTLTAIMLASFSSSPAESQHLMASTPSQSIESCSPAAITVWQVEQSAGGSTFQINIASQKVLGNDRDLNGLRANSQSIEFHVYGGRGHVPSRFDYNATRSGEQCVYVGSVKGANGWSSSITITPRTAG